MVKLNNDLFNDPSGISGFSISKDTSLPTYTKQDASYKFLGNNMDYSQYKKTAFSYTWVVITLLILFMIAIVFIIVFVFRSPPSYEETAIYSTSGYSSTIEADNIDPITQKSYVNKSEADADVYLNKTSGGYICSSKILSSDHCRQLNLQEFPELELVGSPISYPATTALGELTLKTGSVFVTADQILSKMESLNATVLVLDHQLNKIYFYDTIDIKTFIVTTPNNLIKGPFLYAKKNDYSSILNTDNIMLALPSKTPQTLYNYMTGTNNVRLIALNESVKIPNNIPFTLIFNSQQTVLITQGSQTTQAVTSPYNGIGEADIIWQTP